MKTLIFIWCSIFVTGAVSVIGYLIMTIPFVFMSVVLAWLLIGASVAKYISREDL